MTQPDAFLTLKEKRAIKREGYAAYTVGQDTPTNCPYPFERTLRAQGLQNAWLLGWWEHYYELNPSQPYSEPEPIIIDDQPAPVYHAPEPTAQSEDATFRVIPDMIQIDADNETRKARAWFFDQDMAGAGRGIDVSVECPILGM